jgi:hypothetical protein
MMVNSRLINRKVTMGKYMERPSFFITMSPGSLPRKGTSRAKTNSKPRKIIQPPRISRIFPISAMLVMEAPPEI